MAVDETKESVEKSISKLKLSEKISASDKELILKFLDECYSQGLSNYRILFYLSRLRSVSTKLADKNLADMDKDDIKSLIAKLERSNYSEWTKHGYKVTFKKFFQWLAGHEWNSKEYPEKVKWIRCNVKNNRNKRPEILSKDEVLSLIDSANGIRDKAFISVLYESGCRVGELLSLKMKHVDFNGNEAKITVKGKTGYRGVLLISSIPHLANWVRHHPHRNDPESPLWINIGTVNHGKGMKYQNVEKMLKETAKTCGIKKPVNPHNFRKSRATHLANKLTEAQMCKYFGWVQGSDMPSNYVFLSGRDVDNAVRRIHGRLSEDEEKREDELKPRKCPRCDDENSPEAVVCKKCGLPLDIKTAMEMQDRKREFLTSVVTPDAIDKMIEEKVKQILERNASQVKKERESTVR